MPEARAKTVADANLTPEIEGWARDLGIPNVSKNAEDILRDPEIGAAGDVDTAIVTLTFANGALGIIDNSHKAVYGYDQRVEVFGSGGALAAENDVPSQVRLSDAHGVHGDKPLYFFLERYREAFVSEMKAFFEAIKTGTETPVTGYDGLMDLAIGLAAKKSLAEHRPVKVSEVL